MHLAVEDDMTPDEPEGMFPCGVCGQPTWYSLCDECEAAKKKAADQ